ncbi:MAG: Holliday junction branch migration protein RuvA [Patescibacteria group bacterium]
MIGHIKGEVLSVHAGIAIVSAGGLGYKISTTRDTIARLKIGHEVSLWTHLAVRETALDLYGFEREDDLHFFELLLIVPGIGPKSALAILDLADVDTLKNAISTGNAEYLTKVSGVGKKTANKLVLELREKVGAGSERGMRAISLDEEAQEAMHALGYTPAESRDALRKVPASIEGSSARLREALRMIGSK